MKWSVDGEWFDINNTTLKYYKKEISMKTGVLSKKLVVEMKNGKQVEIES
jgi:trehalose/maltose hydrolase-like predicted phosphorylase